MPFLKVERSEERAVCASINFFPQRERDRWRESLSVEQELSRVEVLLCFYLFFFSPFFFFVFKGPSFYRWVGWRGVAARVLCA